MDKVVERVVRTYGMMVNLSADEERLVRRQVVEFVADRPGDENTLAVEAIKHLREPSRPQR